MGELFSFSMFFLWQGLTYWFELLTCARVPTCSTQSRPPSLPLLLSSRAGGASDAQGAGRPPPAWCHHPHSMALPSSQPRPHHPGSGKRPAHTWACSQAPEFQVSSFTSFLSITLFQPLASQPAGRKSNLAPSCSSFFTQGSSQSQDTHESLLVPSAIARSWLPWKPLGSRPRGPSRAWDSVPSQLHKRIRNHRPGTIQPSPKRYPLLFLGIARVGA